MLQFRLPAAHSARVPAGEAQWFCSLHPPRACCHDGHRDRPRAGYPCGERGNGCEKPTSQIHIYMDGKVIEEIRNFLECGGGTLVWDHQVGVVSSAAEVLTVAPAFFSDLPAGGLGTAVVLGTDL